MLCHLDQQVTWGTDLVRLCSEYSEHKECLVAVFVTEVLFRSTVRQYLDLLGKSVLPDKMPRHPGTWASR